MTEQPTAAPTQRPQLTAMDDRIYGETPEDGLIARVYGDSELATIFAAAPAVARERDRLAKLLGALIEALDSGNLQMNSPEIDPADQEAKPARIDCECGHMLGERRGAA